MMQKVVQIHVLSSFKAFLFYDAEFIQSVAQKQKILTLSLITRRLLSGVESGEHLIKLRTKS